MLDGEAIIQDWIPVAVATLTTALSAASNLDTAALQHRRTADSGGGGGGGGGDRWRVAAAAPGSIGTDVGDSRTALAWLSMVSASDLSVYLSEEDYDRSPASSVVHASPQRSPVARLSHAISSRRAAALTAVPPLDLEQGEASVAVNPAAFDEEEGAGGSTPVFETETKKADRSTPVFESETESASAAETGNDKTKSLRLSLTSEYKVAAVAAHRARVTTESRRPTAAKTGTRRAGASREKTVMIKVAVCAVLILAAVLIACGMSPEFRSHLLGTRGAG